MCHHALRVLLVCFLKRRVLLVCRTKMHVYISSVSNLILYMYVLLSLSSSSSPSGARVLWICSIDSLPRRQLHGPVPLPPPFAGKLLVLWPPPPQPPSLFSPHTTHYLLNKLHPYKYHQLATHEHHNSFFI